MKANGYGRLLAAMLSGEKQPSIPPEVIGHNGSGLILVAQADKEGGWMDVYRLTNDPPSRVLGEIMWLGRRYELLKSVDRWPTGFARVARKTTTLYGRKRKRRIT